MKSVLLETLNNILMFCEEKFASLIYTLRFSQLAVKIHIRTNTTWLCTIKCNKVF